MKVIHVLRRIVEEEWGGAEAVIYNYCMRLIERGYDTPVFCTSALGKPGPAVVRGLPIERFPYFYPYFFLSGQARHKMDMKGGSPISFSMFRRLLREKEVDLVHLHSMGRLGALVRKACQTRGIPYVVSLHGGHFTIPPAELALFQEPERKALCWGKPFGLFFGIRRILRDAAAILSVGYAEHDEVVKRVSPTTAVYLPNGVDTKRFASGVGERFRKKFKLEGKRIILCLSRIDPQKGQLHLAQALPDVLKKVPDAHVVIVGSITVQRYYDEIVETLKKNGIENHAQIISGLPPDGNDLVDAYAACDVFALPTRHEPFGIVVLEAWAAHKPVVASRVGGIPHFVTSGKNGLLFEPHDVGGLVESIVRVLTDADFAKKIADNGYDKVRAFFDWKAIVDRLTQVYDRVVSGGSLDDVRVPESMPDPSRREGVRR